MNPNIRKHYIDNLINVFLSGDAFRNALNAKQRQFPPQKLWGWTYCRIWQCWL